MKRKAKERGHEGSRRPRMQYNREDRARHSPVPLPGRGANHKRWWPSDSWESSRPAGHAGGAAQPQEPYFKQAGTNPSTFSRSWAAQFGILAKFQLRQGLSIFLNSLLPFNFFFVPPNHYATAMRACSYVCCSSTAFIHQDRHGQSYQPNSSCPADESCDALPRVLPGSA